MAKRKWFLILIIAIGVLLLSIQGIAFLTFHNTNIRNIKIQNKSEILQATLFFNYRHGNEILENELTIKNLNAELAELKTICKNFKRLVFYYPQEICSSCFEEHLKKILEILNAGLIKESNYCIFTRFDNYRVMKLFRDQNQLTCDIYNIDVGDNSILSMLPSYPLLFTIDEVGGISNFFLINSSSLDLINEYIRIFNE